MTPPVEPSETTIEIENLVKRYGSNVAVDSISFSVRRGEIIGFLGPNGAGKSTTMRIICGFLPATSGTARICGIPVATRSAETKRHIGYMPENNPLPEDLRVREYLRWRAHLKEIPRRKRRSRIDYALDVCDLKRAQKRIIGKLSKGYRQRVGIADAILSEPDVIIMDEPTIGLDPHQIIMIRDLISSLRGRMSMIISSHILPEIEMTCDRVMIINRGRIVAGGTPEELRSEFINRSAYELETRADPDQLRQALTELSPAFRVSETGTADEDGYRNFHVEAPAETEWGEAIINRLAQSSQFHLRSMTRKKPTLEEVFLAATRRSWETLLPENPGEGSPVPAATNSEPEIETEIDEG